MSHLFEVLEPNLMELNLSELTLTSFNLIINKNYCIKVPFNGITSVPNFMKIYQAVQKLSMGGTQRQADRLVI
jgi:hypothetical protein